MSSPTGSSSPRVLAVVPARSGSKGLPNKNIRPLAGLPLFVHSLHCAQMARRLHRTIVSTDGADIGELARKYGADVPFERPHALSGDDIGLMPVLRHALDEVQRRSGTSYEFVVLLDPTSPFRMPWEIDEAIALLEANAEADAVVSCSRPHFNPLWVCVSRADDGYLAALDGRATAFATRQSVPEVFRINGLLYVWRSAFLESATSSLAGRRLMLETPESRALSIDTADEFELADLLVRSGTVKLPWMQEVGEPIG